jgi:hypothetical protein
MLPIMWRTAYAHVAPMDGNALGGQLLSDAQAPMSV